VIAEPDLHGRGQLPEISGNVRIAGRSLRPQRIAAFHRPGAPTISRAGRRFATFVFA
jgi:hypothetical protein